ncbi:hypothetical protein SDC9_199894 [bioreactor metagenome]|uniref:Uncharacterized protein n=1 Tax=bioreactor metagenome TaxID=1076179 RepID=A0A645ILR7_9ZZZZ
MRKYIAYRSHLLKVSVRGHDLRVVIGTGKTNNPGIGNLDDRVMIPKCIMIIVQFTDYIINTLCNLVIRHGFQEIIERLNLITVKYIFGERG